MTSQLKALKKEIKSCTRYKKLKNVLSDPDVEQYNIPFDEYINEVKMRFSSRKFRRIDAAAATVLEDICAATVEDANFRSRLTEMLVVSSQAKKSISVLLDRFEAYILMQYSGKMRAALPTKEERKNFVRSILEDFYSYLLDVEAFVEQINLVVVDIDKANYAVKNMVEAQRLIFRPELRS